MDIRGEGDPHIFDIFQYISAILWIAHMWLSYLLLKTENIKQFNNKGHIYGVVLPFLEIEYCI